jgi:DNA-binding NarL/FixJ family response regulator
MTAPPKPLRVILVDDNPAVLRQTIQVLPDAFDVVDTLEDGSQLAASVKEHQPDLIVLDITLPGSCGIKLAAQLKAMGCTARIVFLTVHADADYAREAFAAGGIGYVLKPRLASDLTQALYSAMAEQRFVSPCPELEEIG